MYNMVYFVTGLGDLRLFRLAVETAATQAKLHKQSYTGPVHLRGLDRCSFNLGRPVLYDPWEGENLW
jgi:hypothetical protein